MMSWHIPSLEHPPAPQPPRLMLWLLLMVIIGVIGFGIGLYLSVHEMLPDTINSNTIMIVVFVVLPIVVVSLVRLFIYSVALSQHQRFTDMLDDARQEWRYWAEKHLGLLTHSRLTQIDEDHKDGLTLASLPINKDNVLPLNALKSLPLWQKKEKVIHELLAPIVEYCQRHALTQPITFYWQAIKEDTDWADLIQEEASRLSLNIESIEPLPYASLSEWLIALYDQPFEPKLYESLSFQLAKTNTSEEASCLLLAPQELYERLRIPVKAKLLRPISTDINDFSGALKTQCEFQLAGTQLNAVWHSGVTDSNIGKCIESYVLQEVNCLSEHLYDADTLLGKGDLARHGITLSLASDYPKNQLIVYQDRSSLLLQQIVWG